MQPAWRPGPGMGFFHTLPSPPSSRPQTPRSLRLLGALASFLETCFLPHLPGHIKTAGRAGPEQVLGNGRGAGIALC